MTRLLMTEPGSWVRICNFLVLLLLLLLLRLLLHLLLLFFWVWVPDLATDRVIKGAHQTDPTGLRVHLDKTKTRKQHLPFMRWVGFWKAMSFRDSYRAMIVATNHL